ncbi:MAG: hypothetical protein ACYDD6_01995, partial [Acidimicrobiales bacterium]
GISIEKTTENVKKVGASLGRKGGYDPKVRLEDMDRPGSGSDGEPLEAGMVLALGGYVWSQGTGGLLAKDVVLVTGTGCERLTRLPQGPLEPRDAEVGAP